MILGEEEKGERGGERAGERAGERGERGEREQVEEGGEGEIPLGIDLTGEGAEVFFFGFLPVGC